MKLPTAKQSSEFIAFVGGLDVVSPMAMVPPGFVRAAVNIEEDINGGYATLKGFERFDGQTAPSSAEYYSLFTSAQGTVTVGDTITGAISGATAIVIALADNAFIVTKVTGQWSDETTTTGGASVSGIMLNGFTGAEDAQYRNLAADAYRADIAEVPGTGDILGVWYYQGVVYAFRNKPSPESGVGMYRSSAAGWQAVSLGYEVAFSNANASVGEGDTLSKGGVIATINRVVVETGTLASGTNTGRLIISAPSGGNFSAGAATSTGGGALTLAGAQTEITIPNKSGRFEFINANFSGRTGTSRMYGVDGENPAFEFDGSVFVPINVGPGIYPKHLAVHQNHLFVSYLSSVLHSGIGDPYNWTTTAGAGEIALSDDVTGMVPQSGSENTASMALYCRNNTYVLYGISASNWNVVNYNDDGGAIPYSIQRMGDTFVLDDIGVTSLRAAQEFGNFAQSTLSHRVKSWFATKRSLLTDSHIARDKVQYRMFFSDGSAAYWTLRVDENGRSIADMMPMQFPVRVLCSVSGERYQGGDEVIFFGSDNGMVYQMDKGTSFDGDEIRWHMELAFNYSRIYRGLKKYRRMVFEVSGESYGEFQSTYFLSYGACDSEQPGESGHVVNTATVYWDSFVWDSFVWDGVNLMPLSIPLTGDGENISIRISGHSDYSGRMKFSGVFLEFSPLRMLR